MKRIGIIGAMRMEQDALAAAMTDASSTEIAGIAFREGLLEGVPCVIAGSGVGKVNAAICAQLMITAFKATHVINTGAAGSLDPAINILDVVVSTDVVHHDVDATVFGYAPGQVPGMPLTAYPADERMAGIAGRVFAEVEPGVRVFRGRVASGDSFIADKASKDRIAAAFGAACTEMEGAGVAQACWRNKVPFLIVRAISDKADGSDWMNYDAFEQKAARHSQKFVRALVPLI